MDEPVYSYGEDFNERIWEPMTLYADLVRQFREVDTWGPLPPRTVRVWTELLDMARADPGANVPLIDQMQEEIRDSEQR